MKLTDVVMAALMRGVTNVLCRVHEEGLASIPMRGPFILVANHVNFLEIPVLYTYLQPRRVTTLAKAETWHNPFLALLFDAGGAIPLRRGQADVVAIRRGLAVLEAGDILALAPEGTRSNDGILQRGHPGIGLLALRSKAPLIPLAFHGSEQYRANLPRLRRTDFYIRVGEPFTVDAGGARVRGVVRQQIVDEIMYEIASLLPPAYRGAYSDMTAKTQDYLRFLPGCGNESSSAAAA
jgi:1-acyl-sn-glycerol-3-phosphate acyltransferase